MSNENIPTEDLHDQLLDRALREVVGGQSPPDLSEKIMLAVTGEAEGNKATLASVNHANSDDLSKGSQKLSSQRNQRIGITIAACVLVGSLIVFPLTVGQMERLKPGQPVAKIEQAGRVNLNATGAEDAFESVTPPNEPQLIMGVTPRIIVQEQEEERLGLVTDGTVNESRGRTGRQSRDSGQTLPSDYYLTDDVRYGATGSEFELAKQAAERKAQNGQKEQDSETFSFSMGFGRGGRSTGNSPDQSQSTREESSEVGLRYRIDASPGKEVNRYLSQTPTAQNNRKGETWGYYRTPNESPAMPASPQNEPGQLALIRGFLPKGEGFGIAQEEKPALIANKQEIERQLREKMDAYHELSEEIGGSTDPTSSSKTNLLISEVRALQAQILKQKEALVNETVNFQLIRKQATSPASTEKAIAEALATDEVLEGYKAESLAHRQKIRALKSTSKSGTSAQIRRYESSLAALEQEASEYRRTAEREIRQELKKSPNAALDMAMTEYVLHRRNVESEIARLNREYETKLKAIELVSEDAKLDVLKAEIEQLTEALEEAEHSKASRDRYARIHENPFVKAEGEKAVSTFSIDVDTASYANVRQFLMQSGQLPPPDAVRIEELINYFDYDYTPPTDDTPFASHVEVAGCPWQAGHRLVRVGIKGREIETDRRPQSNLVFLVDVSGSMNEPAKLPLLVEGMKMLTRKLGENDRIAIVVYASSEGLALPSTRGDQQDTILSTLDNLRAGGSTAGGAGIELAYEIAEQNFIQGGVNRVILATDGDFNVGVTHEDGLTTLAEEKAKDSGVFLTVLGFGRGNLNDSMMEKISNAGNGNYHYVDNTTEARKVLVAEMAGTLVTIAKDVKIQIEFNPAEVAAYRLIGYENRMLKTEDFNNDQKDAGEIGAGHTVTAIYEVIPAGQPVNVPAVDPLKYQQPATAKPSSDADESGEMLTLKLRYKQPDEDVSTKLEFPITDNGQSFAKASTDFKFASAVASFGMLLRHSQHQGHTSFSAVEEIANEGVGKDKHGYRAEFLQLVRQAKQFVGE